MGLSFTGARREMISGRRHRVTSATFLAGGKIEPTATERLGSGLVVSSHESVESRAEVVNHVTVAACDGGVIWSSL